MNKNWRIFSYFFSRIYVCMDIVNGLNLIQLRRLVNQISGLVTGEELSFQFIPRRYEVLEFRGENKRLNHEDSLKINATINYSAILL